MSQAAHARPFVALAIAVLVASPSHCCGEESSVSPVAKAETQLQAAQSGNRLTYLDALDPYYVGVGFPKLVTPQWVGEAGVEAVVVLAIDDMRDHAPYEAYLRPILDRLKAIDGRAAVSIMTNRIAPDEPHVQRWLAEGVHLGVHTLDHPCPLLRDGDFEKARATYEGCVDLLASVPGNRPIAFRMPCCDSLNTLSPRFFAEFFDAVTDAGNYLEIDSSVFQIFTSNDPELHRELTQSADGTERFRRYLPFPSFVNMIENYPYPYVIGGLCWEFPCMVPSDWEAQNIQQPNNPRTVEDWRAALDAVVVKQGTFNLVFHPHNWIRSDQVVELIDYANERYGGRVKFLNFAEAADRLREHLLAGQSLRAADGGDNGVRIVDLNDDGYLDVVVANNEMRLTRIWVPDEQRWEETSFPVALVSGSQEERRTLGARWGIVGRPDEPVVLLRDDASQDAWRWQGDRWAAAPELFAGAQIDEQPIAISSDGRDRGVRLLDVEGDGCCELLVGNETLRRVLRWDFEDSRWRPAAFGLPGDAAFVDDGGHDRGLRLVDLNDDLQLDVVFSNEERGAAYLFADSDTGWSRTLIDAARRDRVKLPMIVRGTTHNGAWFHSRHIWVQNEDTSRLPDLVERLSFNDLLGESEPQPLSAAAALRAIKASDGLHVELVAAEPLVADPIALDWDARGRLWVVEMADYPRGVDGKPGGRVRLLEDNNGDGRYDKSYIFLDGLRYPTSVMAWRDGVLVIASPDLLFAADRDGDGRAEHREVLYAGFGTWNPQHLANGLIRGLDGWIYCANGHSGGEVRSTQSGESVELRGHDFRIRPEDGRIETIKGVTQFVRSRDDWGNWFGNDNSNPLWHYALEEAYLARNPHVVFPSGIVPVPENPGVAPVYPRSRTLARFNDYHTANRFTSACCGTIYRDELLGPEFVGNSFVCEPVHNLVHREIVAPDGISFTSRRSAGEGHSEFLASTDSYFRPTYVRSGPDGAVWVVDMYRLVIEHPEWIPAEAQRRLDLRSGHDCGRIYRVFPTGESPRPIPSLAQLDTTELVAALDSPNGWQRDMAQQLLVERGDMAAVTQLASMATGAALPQARLHALWTLELLGALERDVLRAALGDEHPGVRRQALRLSAARLAEGDAALGAVVANLSRDSHPGVRQQAAYALGAWNSPVAARALASICLRADEDRLVLAAAISSASVHIDGLTESLTSGSLEQSPSPGIISDLLATAVGEEADGALGRLMEVITQRGDEGYAAWQREALAGLIDAAGRRGLTLDALASRAQDADSLRRDLSACYADAREVVSDAEAALENRVLSVRLLGRDDRAAEEDLNLLASLLTPETPQPLQSAAIEALGESADPRAATLLLDAWRGYSPSLRSDVFRLLLSRDTTLEACLAAIERGIILPQELDALARQRLLEHRTAAVRERAETIFAGSSDASRQEVVAMYKQQMRDLSSDAVAGREVFIKRCAVCHRLDEQGHEVGPNLGILTDKSINAMLVAILDPNRAIEAQYLSYTAITNSGLTWTGILADESATSITLLEQEGRSRAVLRSELDELVSGGKSLMPEGLEKDITPQQMVDVIAYVQGSGPPPKTFPGSQPEVVRADDLRREFFCLSTNCEIYGSTLVLEGEYQNLGFWGSLDDRAVWTLDVERGGEYTVFLEWACDAGTAGNTFVLEVGEQRITGKVDATGGWGSYARRVIGSVRLEPGTQRLAVWAARPLESYLFDLKSITLRPGSQ